MINTAPIIKSLDIKGVLLNKPNINIGEEDKND